MKVCSLFSGIGGIDLGFQQAGFDIVWANEFDKDAATTYRHNFGGEYLVEKDVRKVDAAEIPDFDVLVAGFPCQPFSVLGKQKGFEDPRGNLFFEIIRIAKEKYPQVIFLENVSNFIDHNEGKSFLLVFNALAPLGYNVRYIVMDPTEYGNIPQIRTRMFIVAFLDEEKCELFSFPEPLKLTKTLNDLIDRHSRHSDCYYYHSEDKFYSELNEIVKNKDCVYRIYDSGVAKKEYQLCPTLTAYMGRCKERVPIILDDYGIRRITPYECLALQGFPQDFKFPKISLNSAYKQCGNSVVVPVIRRIAENIMKVMD